ncbi:TPA: hypothetical protein ACSP0J_002536 [Aeromonas veronii]|uniref:hypothetical protein n=1 Tax=Aeromonas veronii TaxID=654 RepID=UPI001D069A80|nr:hypothetical protein [Aeromonas veronii]
MSIDQNVNIGSIKGSCLLSLWRGGEELNIMNLSFRSYHILIPLIVFGTAALNTQASEGRLLSQQEVEALGLDKGVGLTREAAGVISEYFKASEADTREQKLERYMKAREALDRYNELVKQQEAGKTD